MFYINNKKVKEWIVKGEGNDQFLHRVRSAMIDNREFYSGTSSGSEFVDIKVYYKGSRIKTTPQFVRKTELSSTTITVSLRSEYNLKVLSSFSSDIVNFSGTANQNPTFQLASTVTSSTFIVYLVPESNIVSTGSYSVLLDDSNFSSVSSTDQYAEAAFDNAGMYVRDSSGVYSLQKLYSIRAFPSEPNDPNNAGYIDFIVSNPPEVPTTVNAEGVHIGYLPQATADYMGFTAEENPNGVMKETPDYWGWGCWADNEQWLWSDAELCEIFSMDSDCIKAEDSLDTLIFSSSLSMVSTFHWGIYDFDVYVMQSIGGNLQDNNTRFEDAWIFESDSQGLQSDLISLQGTSLSQRFGEYFSNPQHTVTLIVPYSQPAFDGQGSMSNLYDILLQQGLVTDIRSYADNFFNITNALPVDALISGTFTTNINTTDGYGYLYIGETLDNIQCATANNPIQIDFSNSSCIYVGARKDNTTLSVHFDSSVSSDIFSSMYFNRYKLIPFIVNSGSGGADTDGTINLNDN